MLFYPGNWMLPFQKRAWWNGLWVRGQIHRILRFWEDLSSQLVSTTQHVNKRSSSPCLKTSNEEENHYTMRQPILLWENWKFHSLFLVLFSEARQEQVQSLYHVTTFQIFEDRYQNAWISTSQFLLMKPNGIDSRSSSSTVQTQYYPS